MTGALTHENAREEIISKMQELYQDNPNRDEIDILEYAFRRVCINYHPDMFPDINPEQRREMEGDFYILSEEFKNMKEECNNGISLLNASNASEIDFEEGMKSDYELSKRNPR